MISIRTAWLVLAFAGTAMPTMGEPLHADRWTEAFEASPAAYTFNLGSKSGPRLPPPQEVTGTVRFTILLSAGGNAIRVRLSNEEGDKPLQIHAASIAHAGAVPYSASEELKPLSFHGETTITVPPGAPVLSDPVALTTQAADRLVVSLYTTEGAAFSPMGGAGMSLAPGDQTRSLELLNAHAITGRPLVSGAAVAGPRPMAVVVALGDSITDGLRMKPDALRGYPEELARRFMGLPTAQRRSVINAGIGGNQVLTTGWGVNALARLDRDVLRINGVTHLIVLEGINDIGMSGRSPFGVGPAVSADDLIAGYRQVFARAHARGVKVIGGTLMPFKACFYYSPEKDTVRLAVNRWIRTSGEFDGVIDFEAAVRDSADPLKLRPDFDSGDHLHPNDAGYKAMGDVIDLELLH